MSEASSAQAIGPIKTAMRDKLTAQLAPAILDILNDSHLQRHHAAMKSVVLARHQLAYRILDQELTKNTAGIHAISLKTLTSKEHQKST
ncbi:hypothetical protein Pst134EA_029306 [Puccinia striiformis f. sp. tritici]|uniref:BolA protein n=1 Tax=Puccinia striiformis f. sp. tritici PST-78 TaxID=1165861 RepID=A0A0L0V9N9_9BASI|nr:hypothetical protein Pst134EA_029306 [Puccinia striiformis f. sp. tritici]KAH9447272.1 hypothetical protein Pst134EA_029306 [Puccinia striiformis f. sp. tritici]KAI9614257.1 hypothetical protein H4Q26_009400 [Puccinia striiformis f. sp. tritici PST-130]KAI9623988.1 hypothetical protein KEM48_009215 [Puccinia striiformis f. sp. tritici PST-130]KNE95995.1 hypothetical protein PSTG_10686 [Puccinia striiformis f. sp. tritici PST-78]